MWRFSMELATLAKCVHDIIFFLQEASSDVSKLIQIYYRLYKGLWGSIQPLQCPPKSPRILLFWVDERAFAARFADKIRNCSKLPEGAPFWNFFLYPYSELYLGHNNMYINSRATHLSKKSLFRKPNQIL